MSLPATIPIDDSRLLVGLALVVGCILAALWDLSRPRLTFDDLPEDPPFCIFCKHTATHDSRGCFDCMLEGVGPCLAGELEA